MSSTLLKCALFLLGFIFLGCSEAPRHSVANVTTDRAIYGEDTREDISQSELDSMGAQTAILISDRRLNQERYTLGESWPLCSNEPFQEQVRLGYCTGVLIAPNLVLTAGHCFRDEGVCPQTSFAFGFTRDSDIASTPLYRCKKIVQEEVSNRADYAIVELDRPVTHVTPATLATKEESESASEFISYSHPLGLPLKRDLGVLLENNSLTGFFKVAVDTFRGSSGSPLFLPNGKVAGILSRGFADYLEEDEIAIQKKQSPCLNFHRCDDGREPCYGERFFKTYRLIESL